MKVGLLSNKYVILRKKFGNNPKSVALLCDTTTLINRQSLYLNSLSISMKNYTVLSLLSNKKISSSILLSGEYRFFIVRYV